MKNSSFIIHHLSLIILSLLLSGCRLGRYHITEPVESQVIEVKSGDIITVTLDENGTTGYQWIAECTSDRVELKVNHEPSRSGRIGAGGTAEVEIKVHRGFLDNTPVVLKYERPWSHETARTINLLLMRRNNDTAPWK